MERFTHLIDREVQFGGWKPVRSSRNGPPISSLAFSDDLIMFCEESVDQATTMKYYLDLFCEPSGSRMNLNKSRVYFSPNTNLDIRDHVCSTLSMESTKHLGVYFGVPLINSRTSKGD